MDKYEFLSAEWIDASRAVRGEYRAAHGESHRLVANYTITDIPSLGGESAEFHLDLQSPLFYEPGHISDADYHVITDFATAKHIYQDRSYGLDRLQDAYADGSVQIEGPVDELREFWADIIREPGHFEMYDKIAEFTA